MNRDEWATRVPGECLCLKVRRAENVARAYLPAQRIQVGNAVGRYARPTDIPVGRPTDDYPRQSALSAVVSNLSVMTGGTCSSATAARSSGDGSPT